MDRVQASELSQPIPADLVIECGQLVEQSGDLGCLGRWPAGRPGCPRLPQVQDRIPCLDLKRVGSRVSGVPCAVGFADQPRGVMREPPGQRVVGLGLAEVGKDPLAKRGDGVSVR